MRYTINLIINISSNIVKLINIEVDNVDMFFMSLTLTNDTIIYAYLPEN